VSSPRVTVGVPTRNRAGSLPRALESVLRQSHADLELLVADNASSDATPEVCARFAAADRRIRVIRHEADVGLTENFNTLLRSASGEFVMLLADDDWLEPDYVARCVEALDGDPELVIVSGGACYHAGAAGEPTRGVELDLLDADAAARVGRYFARVVDNVTIYGLIRRSALPAALPMQNTLAGDWLLCARLAMLGKVRTVGATWVNRSPSGTSSSYDRTVRSMGLSSRERRRPHFAIARFIYADIAHGADVYAALGAVRRRRLAFACAAAVLRARPLDVIEDVVGPLLRRPRLRWVDRSVRPVVRRLQR
jgi:glycosyltransferase involved in cell wall biosynthesis